MSSVMLASSPRQRSRRLWWILAYVVSVAGGLTTLAVDAHRFLYGATPVLRVGASPGPLIVSPDGRTIYLANSTDSITPVSAVTGKAGRSISISGGSPNDYGSGQLAITPDGRILFATVSTDATTVSPLPLARVDLRTGKEAGQIRVPGGAVGFVLSRNGTTLYVVSGDDTLTAVSAVTGRPERREPVSLAITPDGRTLYAAIDGLMGESGQAAPNLVVAIDTGTDRVRASRTWRAPPLYLAMAPDGATVWVVSIQGYRDSTAENTVTPVTVSSGQPGTSFRTSGWLNAEDDSPSGVAMSPGGRALYVTVTTGLEMFGIR